MKSELKSKNLEVLKRQAAIAELFRRGELHWRLHAGQTKMYNAIKGASHKIYVINSSRRLGKSFLLCLLALEHALKHDGIQIKYAAPNQKMARKIVFPLIQQILEGCPTEIKPKFHRHDGEFIFKNGSVITVCGTEMGQVDGLRGTACDLALIDECGFMDNLTYVIDDVLMPQMLDRPNSRMILASTPPVSPDHPYVTKYIKNAMENGAYAKFTIYDNPRLHPDQIEEFKKEAGGDTSTTWRREYMAEIVTDTDNAIFPEATADSFMEQIVFEIPRPTFFIPITAIDLGYIDYTGVLFGYYHFLLNKIVIEDELLVNRTNSALLIDMIKTKEVALWGKTPVKNRVVDGPALVIADLNEQHRFGCRTPDKGDFVARVNRARVDLAAEKVIINPRCEKTRTQIQHSVWDSSRKSFARNSSGGHFDLAAAFIYLIAHINRTSNPYPADFGYNQYTDFGFPRQHKNTANEAFKKMFKFLPERRK
jgi:PBSX family phage terminase large subunit